MFKLHLKCFLHYDCTIAKCNTTCILYMQEGLTPLDVAKKKHRLDVMKFLEENGIDVNTESTAI